MTPEQLKASILQYAVQGKLTEQLVNDGSASELIPKLFIDKKVCANEPPFDIPDSWMWIPIGNLGATCDSNSFADGPFGSNLKTVHYIEQPEVRIIQLSNIGEEGWKDKNIKYTSVKHLEEVIPRCEVHPGDLVIAKMMPAGRTIEVPELGTRITLGSDAMKFVPNPILNKKYLLIAMRSQAFLGQVYAEAHGITRVRTTLNGIRSYVLPIPPIKEQERIVAKIEELLPLVDCYAEAYEKLEKFNAKFPEDMKKSILQYAIMGKLVEQREEEGTAEELYQQIQEEKQKLIEEGKIKKEKPLAEITEDEIPFDIPESWRWGRVGDVCFGFEYGTAKKSDEYGKRIVLRMGNIQEGKVVYDKLVYSNDEEDIDKYNLTSGDLLFNRTNSKEWVGKTAIYKGEFDAIYAGYLVKFRPIIIDSDYLNYVMQSKYYWSFCQRERTDAIGQSNINAQKLKKFVFPLPPLEEQKRIVAKIEELLPYCERLM